MSAQHKPVIGGKTWLSLVLRTVLFPIAIVWPAGTWQWWEAWLLISLWTVFFITLTIFLSRTDPALLIRTVLEDRTLHTELPGYAEYKALTRYRLIPRIW